MRSCPLAGLSVPTG